MLHPEAERAEKAASMLEPKVGRKRAHLLGKGWHGSGDLGGGAISVRSTRTQREGGSDEGGQHGGGAGTPTDDR